MDQPAILHFPQGGKQEEALVSRAVCSSAVPVSMFVTQTEISLVYFLVIQAQSSFILFTI